MKKSEAIITLFVIMMLVAIGISGYQVGMSRERQRQAAVKKVEKVNYKAWCPLFIDARVLSRSVYREADTNEAALVCFYVLPGKETIKK